MTDPTQPPWPAGTRRLRVHDVQIDLRYRRVIRPDQEAELPQRMFDLLLVFLAQPQVLHSRAELFARVWPGVIVEDANLSQSVWMLRKALGESRKHWIRTVAKSGYVFEPPGPVEVADEAEASVPAPPPPALPITKESAAPVPAPAPPAPSGPRSRWRGWALAAVVAVVVAGVLAWWLPQRREPAPPPAARAIALIDVEDAAAPEDTRWPVALLHAWLGWKLESLPEVTLLTEAHLAADSAGRSPRIVFLSSGVDSTDPNRVFLRARFDQGGREQRLERTGTQAEVPAMADALSRELLARLVPARAGEPWPALALDPATARRYTQGLDALEKRDWVNTAKILQEVVERAPRSGLPRLQLGYAWSRLARAAPALEQTEAAIRLLQPVPAEVAAVLRAQQLSRDPQKPAEAARAYGALAARHPEKVMYLLDQAAMLVSAGQPKDALALLNQPLWDRQSVGTRLRQRLNLAAAYLSLGDAPHAREQALIAERIARGAGKGWEQERGEALLLAAQADSYQYEDKADIARYEQAAQQFELAGDDMDALYARFLAETNRRTAPGDSGASERGLDMLLVQARERGYPRLEIEMLRLVAFRHYSRGNMPAYRARLEQALATALTAGDLYEQRLLELDLLNEDFMRGRFATADRRLASLHRAGLQGDGAIWMAQFEAVIAANRGRFDAAEKLLDAAERRDREANPGTRQSMVAARIACMRADISLVRGEMARARAQWRRCAAQESPSSRLQAAIGNAAIDVLAGDRATGLRQLADARQQAAQMQDGPDRWLTELWIATQLTRAGDAATAQRMFERVLPLARQTEYEWIVAVTEAGLAETAATRGDWAAVRRHVAAARKMDLTDIWTLGNRLDVLDAVAAMAGGDGRRAFAMLSTVHAQARRNGDAVTQMEIHSLLPDGVAIGECHERCQAALVARTGLRGATLDWLTGPVGVDTGVLVRREIR